MLRSVVSLETGSSKVVRVLFRATFSVSGWSFLDWRNYV